MSEATEIEKIETDLRLRKVTVKHFLTIARVSSSTWDRIKKGQNIPNGATMRRIRQAIEKIRGNDESAAPDQV